MHIEGIPCLQPPSTSSGGISKNCRLAWSKSCFPVVPGWMANSSSASMVVTRMFTCMRHKEQVVKNKKGVCLPHELMEAWHVSHIFTTHTPLFYYLEQMFTLMALDYTLETALTGLGILRCSAQRLWKTKQTSCKKWKQIRVVKLCQWRDLTL